MQTKKMLLVAFATCALTLGFKQSEAQGKDTAWLLNNTWAFINFNDTNVAWSTFRQTFIGVAPAPSGDFDQLFYNNLYTNTLFNPGDCYGMDVLAMLIMQNGGYAGYCHPPHFYPAKTGDSTLTGPADPNLKLAIEVAHGYQINEGVITFTIDAFAGGMFRDGRYAFSMVHQYLAQGDQPIIMLDSVISTSGDGHVVVPYFEDTLNKDTERIFVYNPNNSIYAPDSSRNHQYYSTDSNVIIVNRHDGSWTFQFSLQPIAPWTGSPSSGGLCIAVPLSVAGKKDRLPQSLFSDVNKAIATIFIFGNNVRVRQITDLVTHRHFFNGQGTDIEVRPEARMKTIAPFIHTGRNPGTKTGGPAAVYFLRGQHRTSFAIIAKGPYKVGMIYNGKYVEYSGVGDGTTRFVSTPSIAKAAQVHHIIIASPDYKKAHYNPQPLYVPR